MSSHSQVWVGQLSFGVTPFFISLPDLNMKRIPFVTLQKNCFLAHNLVISPWVSFPVFISLDCKLQELCRGRYFYFCLFCLLLYHQNPEQ